MHKSGVYLLIGEDEVSKLNKIGNIKRKLIPQNSVDFNLEVLSAKGLNLKTLEETLLRLPINTRKRLLIIRGVQDLSKDCKQKIISYVKKPSPSLALVLEAKLFDREIEQIAKYSEVLHFRRAKPYDVFTLCRAIKNRNQTFALSIVSDLLLKGEKPQKILGGLIWQWEKMSGYLSKDKMNKGFDILLETDLNIKSSRLKSETALEILIIKLILLI